MALTTTKGKPVIKKVIVAAPSSIISNWGLEVKKWLGDERLEALVVQTTRDVNDILQGFKFGAKWPLLITSYELIRRMAKQLSGCCDLLICDEGHRYATVRVFPEIQLYLVQIIETWIPGEKAPPYTR